MANCYKEVKEIKTMSKIQSMIDTFQAINEVRKIKHDQRIQNEQEELKTKTLEKLSKQLAKLEAKKKFKHASTPTEISETFESEKPKQKKLDDGTYFVKPKNLIAMRTALKSNKINAKVIKSGGIDWYVKPEQNTDIFNQKMKSIDEIIALYHWEPFTRKVRK